MRIALMIVLAIASLLIIVSVMLQSSQSEGIGALSGGAQTAFGRKKAKGYEALLSKVTIVSSIVFIVATIVLAAIG